MRLIDLVQERADNRLYVTEGTAVGQTFISYQPDLAGIRMPMSNSDLGSQVKYLLTLSDSTGILRAEEISGANIGWEMLFRFDFPPIADSNGKSYTFNISPLDKTPGRNLAVFQSDEDVYPGGHAYVGNKELKGDLTFETYYYAKPATVLVNSFSRSFSRFSADRPFFIFYLLLTTILLVCLLFPRRRSLQ